MGNKHMLGNEQELIHDYVRSGVTKLQFWHVLDHGNASIQASAAAECAGEQDAFWAMHDKLFDSQRRLWGGDIATLVELASEVGLDAAVFRQCLGSGEMQDYVKAIDGEVKGRGVRIRPTFDLIQNGQAVQRLQGSPPLAQWRQVLDNLQ